MTFSTFSGFSTTGPAAHLMALPQLAPGPLPTPSAVDEHLARTEQARQAQLDALPVEPGSVVTAAHRRTVARILEQVREARLRVREGTYGLCAGCSSAIEPDVLVGQPWLVTCSGCSH
jgi:RNA polymerase-binding transcription factor DksA